jgi:hypothetical protein
MRSGVAVELVPFKCQNGTWVQCGGDVLIAVLMTHALQDGLRVAIVTGDADFSSGISKCLARGIDRGLFGVFGFAGSFSDRLQELSGRGAVVRCIAVPITDAASDANNVTGLAGAVADGVGLPANNSGSACLLPDSPLQPPGPPRKPAAGAPSAHTTGGDHRRLPKASRCVPQASLADAVSWMSQGTPPVAMALVSFEEGQFGGSYFTTAFTVECHYLNSLFIEMLTMSSGRPLPKCLRQVKMRYSDALLQGAETTDFNRHPNSIAKYLATKLRLADDESVVVRTGVTMVPLLYAALDVSAEYCQPHPDVVVIIVRLLA